MTHYAQILGWGTGLPERSMHNEEFEKFMDTNDEWIHSRTGISERRVAGEGETTSTLAVKAARAALAAADMDPRRIDFILVATCTPDKLMPATAPMVQQAIGATSAGAADVNAACAGFMYGLVMATSLIASGMYRNVLVIGADTLTRWLDWEDRRTSILFGDGAGALILTATEQPTGLISHQLGSDGSGADLLHIPGGGSAAPSTRDTVDQRDHFIKMDGRSVFKFAVQIVVNSTRAVLEQAGLAASDLALFIPHQANARIVEAAAKSLQLPESKVFMNLQNYGNTSAASIPIAMCDAIEQGVLCPGDNVALCGFGAGLTWGSAIFQWGIPAEIPATDEWRAATANRIQRSKNERLLGQPLVVGAST